MLGTNMKLIAEQIQEVEYIVEEKDGGGKDMKIRGIFMQADMKNRNGRVYPMNVLTKEVAKTFVTHHIPEVEEDSD